jgi:hypothetical protein
VWSWKDVVKGVPKGRVGSTFVCAEKTWCRGFVMKTWILNGKNYLPLHFLWFLKLKRYILAKVFYILESNYKM